MNAYVANTELNDLTIDREADYIARPTDTLVGDDEGTSVVRGVVSAVIISVPFWSLFGLVLYLLF